MLFAVTILGSGSARPDPSRRHTAQAVRLCGRLMLADCGEGTQLRLMEAGLNMMKTEAVFISHLHGDHLFGLFPMISSMGLMGRAAPLKVFGPAPLAEAWEEHRRRFAEGLRYEVTVYEVNTAVSEVVFRAPGMEVLTVPLRHRGPAVGYIFREQEPLLNLRKELIDRYSLTVGQMRAAKHGEDIRLPDGRTVLNAELTYRPYIPRSYAYTADTMYSGKVTSLVRGVDLLYHEATFAAADRDLALETGHSTALDAARTAAEAGVGRLLIGHISGRYTDPESLLAEARTVFPHTDLARELHTYEIPRRCK